MLTDTAFKNLKPQAAMYKAADRDGMYVTVSPAGTITLRYNYRINGRRQTLTIGRYGPAGLTLAKARERCMEARRSVSEGVSPAQEKQPQKRQIAQSQTFGEFVTRWAVEARMADSTRSMLQSILDRDVPPTYRNRLLSEISADDLRELCNKFKARGAPATAVHVRDVVKQVFSFAILHGEKVSNPADDVGPSSIATFVPKDRALSLQRDQGHAQPDGVRGLVPHHQAGTQDDRADPGSQGGS